MIGLSGMFLPLDRMTPALRSIARALPLTYAVSLLQGIWTGDGWWTHAGDVAVLIAIFCAGTLLSAKLFRWE